jgi:hypothetical protein
VRVDVENVSNGSTGRLSGRLARWSLKKWLKWPDGGLGENSPPKAPFSATDFGEVFCQ